MRHKVYGKHLGRNKDERTTLFKGLVQSLIISESIQTTDSKAKAIKGLVDKLINQAKEKSTQRLVSQFIVSKNTQDKLIKDILPRLERKDSGYTSVVKLGRRLGDGAMMVQMSLLVSAPKATTAKAEKKPEKEAKTEKVEASVDVKTEPKKEASKKETKPVKKETKKKA